MPLPVDFHFSQHNLQDFVDCPRRFQLRYIQKISWPALESEPFLEMEKRIEMGSRFHKLVHQYFSGMDPEILRRQFDDVELNIWLNNFISQKSIAIPDLRFAECTLTAPFNGYRLLAKFDLIVINPDADVIILDWKTSRRIPPRQWLEKRVQSRLYPYLLVSTISSMIPNFKISPENVSMVYWFTDFPEQPVSFSYDDADFQTDQLYLESMISVISSCDEPEFRKTEDPRMCRFCVYRSLCERGEQAGNMEELESFDDILDTLSGFSLANIEEIPF